MIHKDTASKILRNAFQMEPTSSSNIHGVLARYERALSNRDASRKSSSSTLKKTASISRNLMLGMFQDTLVYINLFGLAAPLILTCVEYFDDEQILICSDDVGRYVFIPATSIIYISEYAENSDMVSIAKKKR